MVSFVEQGSSSWSGQRLPVPSFQASDFTGQLVPEEVFYRIHSAGARTVVGHSSQRSVQTKGKNFA